MELVSNRPASTSGIADSRERTRIALDSILTKLGGREFAESYLDDIVEYVFSGELSPGLRELKDAADETYVKVIRVVSEAQAEAIAEAVPEPRPPAGGLWSLFRRIQREAGASKLANEYQETKEMVP